MRRRIILVVVLALTCLLAAAPLVQAAALLQTGSSGSEVTTLQTQLAALGYDPGKLDGIFGPKTKAAVLAFQSAMHLQVDGIAGPLTRQALSQAYTRQQKTSMILAKAQSLIGSPYRWGGASPAGFDCSGFTSYVFATAGITLPRVSRDQALLGSRVNFQALAPGDLVFFTFLSSRQISHVGIYLGNNQFISATTSKGVTISSFSPYWLNAYVGARRVY